MLQSMKHRAVDQRRTTETAHTLKSEKFAMITPVYILHFTNASQGSNGLKIVRPIPGYHHRARVCLKRFSV